MPGIPPATTTMHPAIDTCLRADPHAEPCETVAAWWPRWCALATAHTDPAALALLGGFAADRVGWAFASGYQAALRALVPGLGADTLAALCVTEEGGNRPRDIATRIVPAAGGGWTVNGAKRWTTLGPASSLLLVVGVVDEAGVGEAGAGKATARPALRVARVAAGTPGLRLLPMPDTRFVPEVPHARVELDGVHVGSDALLPGDGYTRCVKPFRTIEDTHVTLAVLAYLLREARLRRWPTGLAERLCAALVTLAALADAAADAPATHVALAGALAQAHALYDEAGTHWAADGDDPAARRWQRDAALFQVAGSARGQRAARAWERLAAP
jgi:alkylation response protein AidB-like acyl-CoA dehydrogenase